jgi:hypothetical protein
MFRPDRQNDLIHLYGATCVTLVGAALFALDWLVFAHLVRSHQHGDVEVFRVVLLVATAIFFVGWLLLLRSLMASRDGVHIVALGVAVFVYDWCLIGYRGAFGHRGDLVVAALAFVSVGTILLGVLVTLWRLFSWSRNSPTSN